MAQVRIKQIQGLGGTLSTIGAVVDDLTNIVTIRQIDEVPQSSSNTNIYLSSQIRKSNICTINVNGIDSTESFSFEKDSVLYVNNGSVEIPTGSLLIFDSVEAGYELSNVDEITLVYESGLIDDLPTDLANGIFEGTQYDVQGVAYSGVVGDSVAGAQGATGAQGANGIKGANGVKGATGAQGSSGISGQIEGTVTGTLIPDTDIAYDLGSATNRFRDLYLSGNTLYMGGQPLSIVNGQLTLNGSLVSSSNLQSHNLIEDYFKVWGTGGFRFKLPSALDIDYNDIVINSNYLTLNPGDEILQPAPNNGVYHRSLGALMDETSGYFLNNGQHNLPRTGFKFISGQNCEYDVGSLNGFMSTGGFTAMNINYNSNQINSVGNTCITVVGIKNLNTSWPNSSGNTLPILNSTNQYPTDQHGQLVLLDRATISDSFNNNMSYFYSDFQSSNISNIDLTDFIAILIMPISDMPSNSGPFFNAYINAKYYT